MDLMAFHCGANFNQPLVSTVELLELFLIVTLA